MNRMKIAAMILTAMALTAVMVKRRLEQKESKSAKNESPCDKCCMYANDECEEMGI